MNKSIYYFVFVIFFFYISCNKIEGVFAYKEQGERFHKGGQVWGFEEGQNVDWVFKCYDLSESKKWVNVFLQKYEVSWIDVYSFKDYFSIEKPCIFGKLKNLNKGNYRLIIVYKNNVVAEKKIIFY